MQGKRDSDPLDLQGVQEGEELEPYPPEPGLQRVDAQALERAFTEPGSRLSDNSKTRRSKSGGAKGRKSRAVESDGLHPRPIITTLQGFPVPVIAFSRFGTKGVCDEVCGGAFLGTHWDLGAGGIVLKAPSHPGITRRFRNAEAAYLALQFWDTAGELDLERMGGDEAAELEHGLSGREDPSYGGYGSPWRAMMAVLRAKFPAGSPTERALADTQQAFLLSRASKTRVADDKLWADNYDGTGSNWLGVQLMLIRDELSGKDGCWTKIIKTALDTSTGRPHSEFAAAPLVKAMVDASFAVGLAEEPEH